MDKLFGYFSEGVESKTLGSIGAEIETQFVGQEGWPIEVVTSQKIFESLADGGWKVETKKAALITCLFDTDGNRVSYELGRHNIELSTRATAKGKLIPEVQRCLGQIYIAAAKFGARPYFGPILEGVEDLLVVPDSRDAIWLELDGRSALAPLARTSSVQFTISVSTSDAIRVLNNLGSNVDKFLSDYPQDAIWKKYISESLAGYRPDRYGGPLLFGSLNEYCFQLSKNAVVDGPRLVPFENKKDLKIPLFLRSVWWHFRLKRYESSLCIEVRPMARRDDEKIEFQLEKVLEIAGQ